MRFVKKNKKAVKVEGKLIVAQEIEVKEVDLYSLSLGKNLSSLYLLPLEDIFLSLLKSSGEDQLIQNVLSFGTERT